MRHTRSSAARTVVLLSLALPYAACTSSSNVPAPGGDPVSLACTDTIDALYGPPPGGWIDRPKGSVLGCHDDGEVSRDTIASILERPSPDGAPSRYEGRPPVSGARVRRLLYRTERGTVPPSPGYSVSTLYLPMKQVAARAPLVVVAHGSRGQGPTCAPSLDSDDARAVHPDYEQLVWPLVGLGYPVIASDWAGFSAFGAEGNPISGFGFVDDVGRSLLDSIAAAHDVAATVLTDDYVLVGHSQGGQLALGTLALSTSYGPDARFSLRGVAAYAPLWLPQRSWGAIPLIESTVPIGPSSAVPVAIWYHYTHGAILDGPDGALAMFREDKRAFLKEWVESSCWEIGFARLLEEGRVYSDFFAKDFIDAVSPTAGLGSPCPADDPSRALCETWMARYRADRPLATGTAQDVPVLVAIGGGDPAIPPDRLACVVDALRRSTRNVAFCFHRTADHGGIMRAHADAVADWIGSVTLGTPRTAQCESDVVELTDGNGNAATCAVIPPNE